MATARFLEFFAGRIANARTRAAYGRAVGQFLGWCEARGLQLRDVSPLHVAAYIRTHPGSVPTVKQHLAAIRMLGDWLVVNQVLPVNPAAAVRGPKHVVTKGSTPVLSPSEARKLLESIDTGALAGIRDRALLSVMLYSFARVSAVLGMRRQDYFGQGSRGWLRLHEKGGSGTTCLPTTGPPASAKSGDTDGVPQARVTRPRSRRTTEASAARTSTASVVSRHTSSRGDAAAGRAAGTGDARPAGDRGLAGGGPSPPGCTRELARGRRGSSAPFAPVAGRTADPALSQGPITGLRLTGPPGGSARGGEDRAAKDTDEN